MNGLIQKNNNNLIIRNTKVIRYNKETQMEIDSRPFLLLDISGSMGLVIDNKRKIDILREVVSNFIGVRMFAFSDYISEIKYIPEPQSSTNLSGAFVYLKQLVNPTTNLVLVSDGRPQHPEDAIKKAIELKIPVNIVYIGSGGDEGEEFMKRLAKLTGGKEITVDTLNKQFQNQLTNEITGLLYN